MRHLTVKKAHILIRFASGLPFLLFLRRCAVLLFLAWVPQLSLAQTNVITQHNDIARTGANLNETILTPSNVNFATFGRLFSQPVDGYVYAQPLYLPSVTMGAGTPQVGTIHNVVFVATQHDSVYAFDADTNTGANGTPLWKASLLDANHGAAPGATSVPNSDVGTGDIQPEIGITGTPVIDATRNTLYVVAKSKENGIYVLRLHALDVTTGAEKFSGPVALSSSVSGNGNGSAGGVLTFDSKWHNQRAGLVLLNGIVYIPFGSHGDNGPWHGWLLAYNATTLQPTGAWCTSPNGFGSGIWMSGTGLAADIPAGKPFGRIFAVTGNGLFDATAPYTSAMDFGDSIVNLDLTNGVPTVVDDFTPHDQASISGADLDQASGGVVLLPDSVGGANGNHQLVQLGKSGAVFVLNRESLGGYNPNNKVDPGDVASISGGLWGSPAYWNGNVYIWGRNASLTTFGFANGTFTSANPTSTSAESAGTYSPTPSISANGTTNGIVWSVKTDNFGSQGSATLYAHDATNVSTLLYSSTQSPAATRDDTPGVSVKFVVPTIVNGKVYVGTESQISIFGLLNGATRAPAPTLSPAGSAFTSPIQVTIGESAANATIYYTTDGSQPTTASNLYAGPFTVSTTETITAMAVAPGYLQSSNASQTYTANTQASSPLFSPIPGNFTTTQSVTIADATPNTTIYYTVDGSAPVAGGGGTTIVYNGPATVSSTTTINALATASGLHPSNIATALYTIASPNTTINFSSGFSTAPATMTFNGSTTLDDTRLQLTNGGQGEAGSAFNNTPVNIQGFTTDFTLQLSNAGGDGMTFTIQNSGLTALGPDGGGLGYGPDAPGGTGGIAKSVAIKFDTYSNQGEGASSTGLYTNGASPTVPAIDLTSSGIDLHSGSTFAVHLTYDGTNLSMKLTDPVSGNVFNASWTINIPATVGGNFAYVGFTAGTGGLTSSQKIGSWTFFSSPAIAAPTFSLASGVYLGTQTISISDSAPGAKIYYTTDGSTPTVASAVYTAPITANATETVNAMAVAPGYIASSIASATYTIEYQVAAPAFSPVRGTFPAAQLVAITSATSGATIYYTTNGTIPSASSTLYNGPFVVSSSSTIEAIATKSGYFNSNVSAVTYTINSSSVTSLNLGSGFTAGSMLLNGNPALNGTRLRLSDGGGGEASSAWYNAPVNIQKFATSFTFQVSGGSNPTGDGFAFVIQGGPSSALGPPGGGLGYGPDAPANPSTSANAPIGQSVAIKFDLYSNAGEGSDSTGLYINGASPTIPAADMTGSGINLHTGDIFNATLTYDGTTLTLVLTDTNTKATYTNSWPINIPSTVGGNTAYVGFTAGTGGATAIQEIIGWTLNSTLTAAATPNFSLAPSTYYSAQAVSVSDSTPGAVIYYTTDGSNPTTSSNIYSGPITVATTETLSAVAVASGYASSAVAKASYNVLKPSLNYSSGFSASGLIVNGSAAINATRLRITPASGSLAGSAWNATPVNVQGFTTDFTFQLANPTTNPIGNGITFTIQNTGTSALGPSGGGLGYGPDSPNNPSKSSTAPIARSVAVKFDLVNNAGEGTNSTGIYINGATPTVPAVTIGNGVVLKSGDPMAVHIRYDGTTLTMSITDTANSAQTFTTSWQINISAIVGANTAYVGFTGGTGASVANQDIITWIMGN